MNYKSMLYYYYNNEIQKSVPESIAVYGTEAILAYKQKRIMVACANHLYSKREEKEKLVLEISALDESENYNSRNTTIYKMDKLIRKIVSEYFSVTLIIISIIQKVLTDITKIKYIYVLLIISLTNYILNYLKKCVESISDMKLSKSDAFYEKTLKKSFKKTIKEMLTEQDNLTKMSESEFEDWFTNQVYSSLDM